MRLSVTRPMPYPPVKPGPLDAIYLDHAATTPLRPEVAEAIAAAAASAFANPSSPHAAGRRAKQVLEDARERILTLLGGQAGGRAGGRERDRFVFTSGATEANRLGILGTETARPGLILCSARDHLSIRSAASERVGQGWIMADVPLAATGSLESESLTMLLDQTTPGPRLLAVTLVCGQTGICEDIAVVATEQARRPGLMVHADATQAAAWEPLDLAGSPFTTAALAPHKFGGPRGIGGLFVRGGVRISPLVPGPQELGLRGGTEAVALAAGFATALELVAAERADTAKRVTLLRHRLEMGVVLAATQAGLEAMVIGEGVRRAPHIATIAIAGTDRQAVVMAADLAGICLATGTACASGSSEPAAALVALGVDPRLRGGAIRASVGRTTTTEDVDEAIFRLQRIFERMRP